MKITTNKEMEIHDNSKIVMAPIINTSIQKTTVIESGNYFVPTPSYDEKTQNINVTSIIGAILIVGFVALVIVLSL